MAQKNVRMIAISEKNYETLRELGTITDSFDSVVTKLLETSKPLLKNKKMQQQLESDVAHSDSQAAAVGAESRRSGFQQH